MNRIILAGFVMLTTALPLFAQEQPPVLDSGFGIKLFSLGEYEAMVNVEQSSDEGFYIDGNLNGLIRLDAAGNKLWGKPYAMDSSFTYTEDISLDSRNNIYAGMVNYRSGEVLVQKYDSGGNLVKSYVTPPGRHFMSGVVFNKDLNKLYAALNYYDGAAGKYVLAVKIFDENLNITASTIYSAPTTVWAEGGIGLDKAGNVYVSGTQMKTTSTPAKHIGLKYDTDLNFIWESSAPFILQQGWTGSVAVFDGGMYLTCFEDGDTHDRLLNISSDGVKMWEKPVPEDYGYYKGVDKAGNFYGSRFDEENNWTPTISKLRYADGDTAWSVAEPQSYKTDDIYVDSQTKVYTVGELMEPVGDVNYYIARYVQGEAPKNSITKSAPPEPHLVNINAYSAPLVSLVRGADGNPAENVDLTFNISRSPDFAVGQQLTKNSERTSSHGLADVLLKLGNIPAEYDVTAKCETCAPKTSSVTFTCCGKLPNDHFSQSGVPAWSPNCYANNNCQITPNATIGWRGCALTSLATLINYYSDSAYSGIPRTNPGDLNTYLRGLPGSYGYDGDNDVNFHAIERYSSGRVSYVGEYDVGRQGSAVALLDIADGLIRSGIPLVFKVRGHFLLVVGKCGNNFVVADPAGGLERLYNPDNSQEKAFRGLRIFSRY